MQNKYSASVCTLGCRVNQYETDCIISEFISSGFEIKDFNDDSCDIYVINTCAVTAGSDKKSKQMIRRAKKLNPCAIIAVCGCFSQANPEIFKSDLQADIILGTPEKTKIVKLALDILNSRSAPPYISVKDISEYKIYENINAAFSEKTRAYIKIQDGCEAACSYCIIPQVRGGEKSRAYEDIYAEIKRFERMNYHEIVLTGIEISSYENGLIYLLEKLNHEPDLNNIKSIRLSSVDPSVIKKDFTERLAKLDKVANHLHLSLQSGSSRILKLMRRRYNAEQAFDNISYAKSKINNLNITADIIAGFPGETDADFELTLKIVKNLKIYHAHIFKYSKRPGTDAANYAGQVPENIKNARSKKLASVCAKIKAELHAENTGREFDIILEDWQGGYYTAKTKNFIDVKIKNNDETLRGSMRRVRITGCDKDYLYGEMLHPDYF